MANNGIENLDFYQVFVEHVFLKLEKEFDRRVVGKKFRRDNRSCRIYSHSPGIVSSITGNHTLCRLVNLTGNEIGKLEWFASDQRREIDGRMPRTFILIFYKNDRVKKAIGCAEDSYKFEGELMRPYNFAIYYAPSNLDTSKW